MAISHSTLEKRREEKRKILYVGKRQLRLSKKRKRAKRNER